MTSPTPKKIISLHLQKCSDGCPNASVCYLGKRNELVSRGYLSLPEHSANSYFTIHESICSSLDPAFFNRLNYNITISCLSPLFKEYIVTKCEIPKERIQLSIYNKGDAQKFLEYQKLYLIFNENTLSNAYRMMGLELGKIHYVVDKNFVTADILLELITVFMRSRKQGLQTLDSCVSSWFLNGHCPFDSNNYIDISYDLTYRKCPFESNGEQIPERLNYYQLFEADILPKECIYKKLLGGANEGTEDSNLQNNSLHIRNRVGPQRWRRLALRR